MKTTWKMVVDLAATIFLLTAMGFRITGTSAHEIVGVRMFVFVIIHNILNRQWYTALPKGHYGLFRIVNTAVNVLLTLSMLILLITGVMTSRFLFPFVPNPDGMFVRQLHVLSAYWSLIFASLHLGLHWNRVLVFLRKALDKPNRIQTYTFRLVAFLIFLFGAKVFFDREIWAKLTMYYSFDFLDSGEPAILFFVSYLSLMASCVFLGHYGMKLLRYSFNDS